MMTRRRPTSTRGPSWPPPPTRSRRSTASTSASPTRTARRRSCSTSACRTADGNIAAPDKLQADIDAERGAIRIEVEVISIGEDIWLTDPFGSGTWQRIEEGIAIRDIFAPDEGIPELLRGAVDARVTGSERIDGVATYRIEAEVDAADIESLAPVAEPGVIVPVTVWIGQDDSLLRRARLEGPINNEESDDIRRQIELSGFDEPVTIEPPETG